MLECAQAPWPASCLHAGLSGDGPVRDSVDARAALERLVRRSQKGASGDSMALVAEARAALEPDR